jgi:hypothetical protein
VLDDPAVHVDTHRLGGGGLEGVSLVQADPAGPAHDGLGHVVGPLVGQLVGVDLDGLGALGENRGAERSGGLGGLPGQGGLPAPGGHGPYLGELPVALGLQGVGGFPFRHDLGLVGGQLLGGWFAAL